MTRFGMWPALQPTPKLSCLLSAGSPKTEGEAAEGREDEETPLPSEGTLEDWRHRGRPSGEPSTERVEQALSAAFDRLWRDRPGCAEPSGDAKGADASLDPTAVDTYISHYFRHVAELSRESVYQAHQRAILCRMRDDIVAGDRSGNMRELEARIEKVDTNDKSLQAEIANLMRIVEPEDAAGRPHDPCCGNGICCRPVMPSAAAGPEPVKAVGETGKVVPACEACTVQ